MSSHPFKISPFSPPHRWARNVSLLELENQQRMDLLPGHSEILNSYTEAETCFVCVLLKTNNSDNFGVAIFAVLEEVCPSLWLQWRHLPE